MSVFGTVLASAMLTVSQPANAASVETQLACMTEPASAEAASTYDTFIAEFSPEVTANGKMDPEFRALIISEGERCAKEYGWTRRQADFAKLHLVGSLLEAGSWNSVPLSDAKKAQLAAEFDRQGPDAMAVVVSAFQNMESPSSKAFIMQWTTKLMADMELADDYEMGTYLGNLLVGWSMTRNAKARFAETFEKEDN